MRPGSWERVSALFVEALGLPPEEHRAFLDGACGGDPDVRDEVARLLAIDRACGDPPPGSGWAPGPGARIGVYAIVREIGSGGMGTVFEAVQERPRRTVALKMLRNGLASPARVQRFLFEAETLGRLRHPAVAQVFAAGTHVENGEHYPYFAMELVPGARDVVTYVRERGLPLSAALALFVEVCEAVHHGHQRGVIHRDLKAENILVDGEGRPKVIDFGVARCSDLLSVGRATEAGELVGTLAAMSPEQVHGDPREIDARTDVYSLGVVLFEVATGAPPYDLAGLSLAQAVERVRNAAPPSPPGLPRELAWVLGRALEKEPGRRYASASELGLDLARFLRGEPVTAGPPGVGYRLRKLARRHRLLLGALAAVLLALGAGLARAHASARAEARARTDAVRVARRATAVSDALEWILTSLGPQRAGRDVTVEEVLRAAAEGIADVEGAEPSAGAALHKMIGASYAALHRPEEAERHLSAARAFAREHLDPDDRLSLEIEIAWAGHLAISGASAEAAALARALLPRAERVLGPAERPTIAIHKVLATSLYDLDDLDAAEQASLEVLRRLRAAGADGRQEADALLQLAAVGLRRGSAPDLARARERARTALELSAGESPSDGFRRVEARQILEHVALAEESLLGAPAATAAAATGGSDLWQNQCVALASRMEEGMQASRSGDHESAYAAFASARADADRLFGPDSLVALQARNALALEALDLGRIDEAGRWSDEAVDCSRRTLPPAHRTALRVEAAAALVLSSSGEAAEAARRFREVLCAADEAGAADDAFALDVCVALGEALFAAGDAPALAAVADDLARRSPGASWRTARLAELRAALPAGG